MYYLLSTYSFKWRDYEKKEKFDFYNKLLLKILVDFSIKLRKFFRTYFVILHCLT